MSDQIAPSFIRLPESKTNCPHTGYSRTGLYNLTVPCKANGYKPAVPAKCDRKPGNLRGIWLIPYAKLIAYIDSLPTPGLKSEPASNLSSQSLNCGSAADGKQARSTAGAGRKTKPQRRTPASRPGQGRRSQAT